VTEFGPDLWNLLCDMFATNTAANGAGLAAPQVGVDLAVFVYDCLDGFGRLRQGQDQFGEPLNVKGTGTLARCLQHETDHVNGIVMEDHLSPSERRNLRRQHKRVAADYPDDWPASPEPA
jgi:peptide deformylase